MSQAREEPGRKREERVGMIAIKRARSSDSNASSSAADEMSRGKRALAEIHQREVDGEAAEAEMRDREIELGGEGGHPYGIQPWGNSYSPSAEPSIREPSLGALRVLSDEALVEVLGQVGARGLCTLARTSRILYVLSHIEDLWKALVILSLGGKFRFRGSWRETYKSCLGQGRLLPPHRPIKMRGVYSDALFQPWLCSSLTIPQVGSSAPIHGRCSLLLPVASCAPVPWT